MSDITNLKNTDNEEIKIERTLRPQSFSEVIGREKEKTILSVMIAGAKSRGEPIDHIIFHGPPGLGKTSLALVIAKEMNAQIQITSGPAIERAGDLASILTSIQEGDILFIDEIHRLNKVVEEVLYPAMEDFAIDIVLGKGAGARSVRLDLPRFTVIGATTKYSSVAAPLRDRFGTNLRLDFYTASELADLVIQKNNILNADSKDELMIDYNSALDIGQRSRGTARIAIRILKRVRDYASFKKRDISKLIINECCEMLEIDKDGLDEMDRKILTTIRDKFNGGPVGLSTIAAAISEEESTIEDVYEPYLLKLGLIQRTPKGRIINDKTNLFDVDLTN